MVRVEPFSDEHVEGVVALCESEGWLSWTPETVARAFSSPGVMAVVAIDDGGVIGAAELLTDGVVMGYLGLLVVAERARRQGVGRALIADLFSRSGLSRIDLLSEDDSVAFYESFQRKRKPGLRIYDTR